MFPKLMLIIFAAGAIACVLLVNRQQRIDTIHKMSAVHHRMQQHEHNLWSIQIEIAKRCRPGDLRKVLNEHFNLALKSIPAGPPDLRHETVRYANFESPQSGSPDFGG